MATLMSGKHEQADERGRLSPFYSTGPLLRLNDQQSEDTPTHLQARAMSELERTETEQPKTLPPIQGTGQKHQVSAYGQTLRLEGRTDATFDGGSFRTRNVHVRRSTDCEGCENSECLHAAGTLIANYSVATRVTLLRASDFPGLTPCQRARVQDAIVNILTPHEQQHVAAFRQYNGTTRRPFDLKLCRGELNDAIRSMFEAEEHARRAAAQAASDALDPFHFDVDLNCEDESSPSAVISELQGAVVNPDENGEQ
ncbi:hypothetical protein [Nitrosomonas nitrosa]|uniref:hypothetical protein n=1 Tax=Nitrosomonas nitrosa TaxID=52442 RepID=UPI0023F97090|nr:hypothetical protein [Nitrosomonas nitrosa]MCO6433789.1 hypothetical protein [Nitrosomonas nitrosa]